jgi:hypothetical protein
MGSTQPLTEIRTRNISSGAKGGRYVGLTYHLHVPIVLTFGILSLLELHPSGRTMALGSPQPLTEMSIRNTSLGGGGEVKGGWCVELTTLPPSGVDCPEIWEPQPPVTLRACPGL